MVISKKSGKKNRKYGRNAVQGTQYRNLNRRVVNKVAKVKRHLKRFPEDRAAINWLKNNA
jgi:hypothetical protein